MLENFCKSITTHIQNHEHPGSRDSGCMFELVQTSYQIMDRNYYQLHRNSS